MSHNQTLLRIFKEFLSDYPKHFLVLFGVLVVEGLISGLSIIAVVPMADFLVDAELNDVSKITEWTITMLNFIGIVPGFWVFGAFFIGANLLRGLTEVVIRFLILQTKYSITRDLFNDALRDFLRAKWGFFSGAGQGVLLNTLNKELGIIGDTFGHIATLFAQFVQLLIYLIIPLWIDPILTMTAIGSIIVFSVPFLLLNRLSYRLGKRNTETSNRQMGVLNEVLASARIILGFGRQSQARDDYLYAFDKHVDATLRSQVLSTAISKIFQPFAMMSVIVTMGIAFDQGSRTSELVAVMWALLNMLPIFTSLIHSRVSISNFLPSYNQLLNLRSEAKKLMEKQGDIMFFTLKNSIYIKCVNFSHPGRKDVLHNLSILFKKGAMTALVGHSGSGKSTIADLILGLQSPDKGKVLIDGVSFDLFNKNSFREKIGYVPQDPILFHSTIRKNLLWSNKLATDIDLWEALRLANAKKFVEALPKGIDTIVGDRGMLLSGGQRQRISLARALIRNPEVLILDEATSSLDIESEELIQESIDNLKGKITIIVIAHRISTIRKANQIYILSNGTVSNNGTFEELRKDSDSDIYKALKIEND